MAEVIPAIIPKSFEDLQEKATKVAPFVTTAQIDIMDGYFTPEPSFPFIKNDDAKLKDNFAKQARIGFELDMMVHEPEKYFDMWSSFGVTTFIIHFESTDRHEALIEELRKRDKGVALAFKPSTPIDAFAHLVEKMNFIQCMGNDKIGFHGVELSETALVAIKDLHNRFKDSIISCDIGVNYETAPKLIEAGVSKLVSGSAIFKSADVGEAIRKLSITS